MATSKPTTYICKNKYRGIFVCHQLIQLEILILETLVLSVGIGPIPLLSPSLSNDFRSVLNCLASHHWTIHNTIVFRRNPRTRTVPLHTVVCLPFDTIDPFFSIQLHQFSNAQIKKWLFETFNSIEVIPSKAQSSFLEFALSTIWICFVERKGFEPLTPAVQKQCSSQTELTPHKSV